jgi:hypothetical protein
MAQTLLTDGSGNIYLVGSNVATVNVTTGNISMNLQTTFNPNTFTFADNYLYTSDYNLTVDTNIPFPTTSLVGGTQVSFTLVVPINNTYKLNFVSQYSDIAGYNNNTVFNAGRYQVTMINEGSSKGIVNILEFVSSGSGSSGSTPLSIVSAIAATDGLSINVLFNQTLTGTSNFSVIVNGSSASTTTQTINGSTSTINITSIIFNNATVTISGGTTLTNSSGTAFIGASSYTVNTSGIGVTVNPASNLTLTNLKDTLVALQWTASLTIGATYQVYRDSVAIGSLQSSTKYTDSTVTANTTYVYTVKAYNSGSYSLATSNILIAGSSQPNVTTLLSNKSIQVNSITNYPTITTSLPNLSFLSNGTTDSDFSIAFDVFIDSSNTKTYQSIFCICNNTNKLLDARIDNILGTVDNSRLTLTLMDKNGGENYLAKNTSVINNNWLKVVLNYTKSTSDISFYINNISVGVNENSAGTYTCMANSSSNLKLSIGNNPIYGEVTLVKNLLIDNVFLINRKLTVDEISELYNSNVTKYSKLLSFYNNIVVNYPFNNSLNDSSANGYNLTATSPIYNASTAS